MYDESNSDHQGQGSSPSDVNVEPSNRTGNRKSKADTTHRCSRCGKEFLRSASKHMPFCGKQCQQVDLGMWLNESYGMPYEGELTQTFAADQEEDE